MSSALFFFLYRKYAVFYRNDVVHPAFIGYAFENKGQHLPILWLQYLHQLNRQ